METQPTLPTRGRILVADDEPHIRRVLVTILENASFEIHEAHDGAEAKAKLNAGTPFDFFLLDLMMPYASGLEVLGAIRAHAVHRHTPVIILTAKGQDTDREAALSAGADDFLTKPFSPKKLLARIQEILADR
ncbi:MAG TPA: response regulator [Longimicrobiales bacterium]|nr:response regulator [Longimicrobiales bacterium]